MRAAAHHETLLPLHLNVFAATVAELPRLTSLGKAVHDVGRRPWEINLDLVGPFTHVPAAALLESVAMLRRQDQARGADPLTVYWRDCGAVRCCRDVRHPTAPGAHSS